MSKAPATRWIDLPVRFQGSSIEKGKNRETHYFVSVDEGEYRCIDCDCKPSHAAADYPCGTKPPRKKVFIYE